MPITSDGNGRFETRKERLQKLVRDVPPPEDFPVTHWSLRGDQPTEASRAAEIIEEKFAAAKRNRKSAAGIKQKPPKLRTKRVCFWMTDAEHRKLVERISGGKVGAFIIRQCLQAPLVDSQTLGTTD